MKHGSLFFNIYIKIINKPLINSVNKRAYICIIQITQKKSLVMATQNTPSVFELYNTLELTKEVRLSIRNEKNRILSVRYPNGLFTTDEHEQALIEAAASHGIIL